MEEWTRNSVLGLVVKRLYFGRRPSEPEVASNASILKRLAAKGVPWDRLARAVEGLALRRDRGELGKVARTDPVSLRWLVDKDQTLNQVAVCEDAYYRLQPKRGPGLMGEIMARMAKEGQ